jgi:dethiobiotin synthetase
VTAVFVTGTGTDVGKTFVSAALIRHWRAAGRAVEAIKPLVSGFDATAGAASDPGMLLAALGRPASMAEIEHISPWRFAAPMSPDLAAAREGRTVDFKALVAFCREAAAAASRGLLLIEGVGGVMVPLDETHTVLDWMTALRFPVLLVTGSYLGTISHTLTALHVLAQRNLDIAAVVVSESPQSGAPLDDTLATITRFADSIEVVGVPRLADDKGSQAAFARIASLVTG